MALRRSRGDAVRRQQACPIRGSVDENKQDVLLLKELIEAGEFRAVTDRRYPMDEVVEAHRYVETWHKAGNVVLTIATDPSELV